MLCSEREGPSVHICNIKCYPASYFWGAKFTFQARMQWDIFKKSFCLFCFVCLHSKVGHQQRFVFPYWDTCAEHSTGRNVTCSLWKVFEQLFYCMLPPERCSYFVPEVHSRLQGGTGKLLMFVYFISNTTMPRGTGRAEVQISTPTSRFSSMVILLRKK